MRHQPSEACVEKRAVPGRTRVGLLLAGLAAGTILLGTPTRPTRAESLPPPWQIETECFGYMPDGQPITRYVLSNPHGMQVTLMTLGATLTSVVVPDRDGQLANVTLHLDTLDDYLRGHPLFGSVVGRYANRIAGARFSLDGTEYPITANAGPHHIHGGREGFQRIVWDAEAVRSETAVGVRLTHQSPDGHEGYPGQLDVTVLYELTHDNQLRMVYTAETDQPTHVNLTNHAYWNLAGAGTGDVLDHVVMLSAEAYLPTDEAKLPTGEIRPVAGTVMDFRQPRRIGERIEQVEGQNYDHCFVLGTAAGGEPRLIARVQDPCSGRMMEVLTNQPGVQFFTARFLSDRFQAGGRPYGPYFGLCLETQHYPDTPNQPHFPSTVLRPGEVYYHETIHRFGVFD